MIGKTLSHYRVVEKIGAGGMGEVYRAHDERLERDVALKVLPTGTLADEQARKRFRKEALALSKLNHPNIATVFDFDTQNGVDFLVMELVEGVTLSDKLASGPLPEKEITRLGAQLAEGLTAAHERRVVHRDLKPANLRVTPDGRLKILDFGLAKLVRPDVASATAPTESFTETQGVAGTLPYMAPEQLRGEQVDARTDIHALGAVLYEMATGQRPFPETQGPRLIDAILHQAPQPPSGLNRRVSPGLEGIILKALEKEPENRYQSAKELAVDLRRLGAPTATAAPWQVPRGSARWGWGLGAAGLGGRRMGRRVWAAGVALVALLAVLVGLNVAGLRDRLLGGVAPGQITSLAVLPLENLMGDSEQDYFVAGMHEALITELSKIGALTVISRTSAMRYRNSDKSVPEIARELGVDAVVEGSVFRVENTVRITAQLIEAATDRHLWADNFDRDLTNILALHSDVARAIAREIQITVTPEEESRLAATSPVNPEAYEAYLKGWFHQYRLSSQELDTALQYYKLALEKDPDYALAYVGIGYVWAGRTYLGLVPALEASPKAKVAALKALDLDDTLAEAHEILATVLTGFEWEWPAAEREFRRAIELNPNYANARAFYSLFLTSMGRPQEGRAQIERALELDPLNSFFRGVYGWDLMFMRQYDDAIAQVRKAHGTEPHPHVYALWVAFHQKRMYEEAVAEAKKYFAVLGHSEVAEALAGYTEGGYPRAMRRAAEVAARSKLAYVLPTMIAALYAHAGEKDRALDWLEKAYQERDPLMVYLNVEPTWDSLRDDPRFQSLLRRMNFPE